MDYSDYIIYADESGNPNPASVDPDYPVFVLNFCVFRKDTYAASAMPIVTGFKFKHFGHDMVVLHENELRLHHPPFSFLRDEQNRDMFLGDLDRIIRDIDFNIIAAVVDKRRLAPRYTHATDVYELALDACTVRLHDFLSAQAGRDRVAHIVVESRSRSGDGELSSAFQRLRRSNSTSEGLEILFADKKTNSIGLQIADLTARPIGRHFIDPDQRNRAWIGLAPKLLCSPEGSVDGWGITILPQ